VLARRSAVPVRLDLGSERRLPEQVEAAAYYVVSEAPTNAAKHAHASVVKVELGAQDAIVRLAIRDDGIGGADPGQGSGWSGSASASTRSAARSRSQAQTGAAPRCSSRSQSKCPTSPAAPEP
jgi:signal transduction histidine kinase